MADDRAYRIAVRFEASPERYLAVVPELELEAEGATRAEALAAAEAAIEARFEAAAVDQEALPAPADLDRFEGETELSFKLAPALMRELNFYAKRNEQDPAALAEQLLVHAIGLLGAGRRPSLPPRRRPAPKPAEGAEDKQAEDKQPDTEEEAQPRQNQRGRGRGRNQQGRGRGRRREGYRPEIENQADFLAYVRDMERGGGRRR